MELVEPGWVVIERLAVQHLDLLFQRFLFPVFVQQHSALVLVAVPIQQARRGKASTLLHVHTWHTMLSRGAHAG